VEGYGTNPKINDVSGVYSYWAVILRSDAR